MKAKVRLIDRIFMEIQEKDILDEIVCISLSREALDELKRDYEEEFRNELLEAGRKVSDFDIKEHFGKPLFIQKQLNGKEYTLLRPI